MKRNIHIKFAAHCMLAGNTGSILREGEEQAANATDIITEMQ